MKRVLIAEDDLDLRDIFSRTFLKRSFNVQVARDGQEALEYLHLASPDVLVLDINMPRVSGLDILTYIHQRPELQGVKIIIVTGNTKAVYEPQIEYADLLLTKPVSLHDLANYAEALVSVN
ncbi:MAG: response regulator [Chloroflexi bacterium]|nr:response regulator [Chloroflexota bacterium]